MRRSVLAFGVLTFALGAAPAGAASVQVMVVGKERVLREAGPVRLKPRSVRVGGRRCAVGRATPLSVLAGTRLPLRLKDYGSCGSSAADAGALYVRQIGPDPARGQDGWVYKVGHRLGTTGAADPSGSFGTGRALRGGQRVLWFWCEIDAGRCPLTLEVRPAATRVRPDAALAVRVVGYDDFGARRGIAGATVRLGSSVAITDGLGVARVTAPASGAARLVAEREGMVRSFPRRVVIR
jgi:hypothetical protein